ncbi:MAG: M20/M25/M40 family metallo-hydrolase [Spirochaetaceae bacterium]|jgi:carboxypeptidase PM20D1|nr:M20/M25/M40 family metallo-hydrolase [Spirochaetaceae bacterium]
MEPIDRFRAAVRIKTDWPSAAVPGDPRGEAPLVDFRDFLAEAYPAFHKAAERWALSPYALVYRWPGGGTSGGGDGGPEKPVLVLAHYDVVPAETEKWTVDPFGAELRDGYVYGRGTLDMKSILIGIMEGAESLCARGFRPRRDIWFAFGGDEERTGILGARETARWFAERGLRFSFVLDEGTPVAEGMIPGVEGPLALFGIEEKGFLSLDLSVQQQPGHASRPPGVQAAAVLARALVRIAKKPFPFTLSPTAEVFFRKLSAFAPGPRGWVMAHARLLGKLFFKAAAASPDIAALLRTTVAMTQLEGSPADNVMPSAVRAVLNIRLLSPWTIESAVAFIERAIGDKRVAVGVHGFASGPIPANPGHTRLSGPGWKEMCGALEAVYPGTPVFPFMMLATTDSRHYRDLAEGIFRFSPHRLNPRELALIHGHDERISTENFAAGVRFYEALFEGL